MSKLSREEGETVSLPDGRSLGYLIVGEGKPVFYFHGLPGSRLDVFLQKGFSSKHLQMIGVDRPGFGLSTFAPNRRVSDFAADISFLANHLRIDKFALLGISGGAHYVITCAALLTERVTRAVVISGASLPIDTSEMSRMNRLFFTLGTMPIVGTYGHIILLSFPNDRVSSYPSIFPNHSQNIFRYDNKSLHHNQGISISLLPVSEIV